MTSLPDTSSPGQKKLGLVIDLDICVGCHACATSCKEWNAQGYSAPLSDRNPYDADPLGTWLNRVHSYEALGEAGVETDTHIVHFPRSCLHCEDAACVTVCPTGASYKRAEDGIVLVNPDTCIGCKLCSWACPYGAREYDYDHGVRRNAPCASIASTTKILPLRIASRHACALARLERAISATLAIRKATSRASSPSAMAMIFFPRSAIAPSTNICLRAPAGAARPEKPSRSPTSRPMPCP
jgi:Fe-S-cluster-containing dehydrogenase component